MTSKNILDIMDQEPCISQISNGAGHLYNDSKYAHFSQITAHNKDTFPLFCKATPIEFTLNPGDCLYIPPKWWHWVRSFGSRCISINFWFADGDTKINNIEKHYPKIYVDTLKWSALQKWSNEYLIEVSEKCAPDGLWLWIEGFAYKKRITMRDFISKYGSTTANTEKKEFAYLITLKDYEHSGSISNRRLLDILSDDFSIPTLIDTDDTKSVGYNFWMNFGGIDTGLHFDDDGGLLCVVDGTKKVTLYSPDDTPYLYPYPLESPKLLPVKVNFMYNLYKECGILPKQSENISFGIHSLLELTLKKAPNLALLTSKLQNTVGPGRIVYGIKNIGGLIKWEYYFYGIDRHCTTYQDASTFFKIKEYNEELSLDNISTFLCKEGFNIKSKLNSNNINTINYDKLILYSLDFTEENVTDKNISKINLYYSMEDKLKIPFILYEQTYLLEDPENKLEPNSVQYIDLFSNVVVDIKTITILFKRLNVSNNDIVNVLQFIDKSEYKCTSVSLVNKKEEIGVYFFGIAYESFVKFLLEYMYPPDLLDLVCRNKEAFADIQIEVGFHFRKGDNTSTPSRTAFYGLF